MLFLFVFLAFSSSYIFTNVDGTAYNFIDFTDINPSLSPSTRVFYAYVPESLRSLETQTVVPLLIGIHGTNNSGAIFDEYYSFADVSESTGEFVFVSPSGICTEGGVTGDVCQNLGRDFDDPSSILFLEELIYELTHGQVLAGNSNLLLDPENVFLTGHSQGAYFAYAYVQVASGRAPVRTIAPYAGHAATWLHWQDDFELPRIKANLFVTFGTADLVVPMEPGLSDSLTLWFTDVLRCSSVVSSFSDLESTSTTTDCNNPLYTLTTYGPTTPSSGCNEDSYVVQSVVVSGLNHDWPGGYVPPQDVCASGTRSEFLVGHVSWGSVVWAQIKAIGLGEPADPGEILGSGVLGKNGGFCLGLVLVLVSLVL